MLFDRELTGIIIKVCYNRSHAHVGTSFKNILNTKHICSCFPFLYLEGSVLFVRELTGIIIKV